MSKARAGPERQLEREPSLKVYKDNTSALLYGFAVLSAAIAMGTIDAAKWGLLDGGRIKPDVDDLIVFYGKLVATVGLVVWAAIVMREKIFLPWRFLSWNAWRVPFIAMSKDELVLLNRVALPWSSIREVSWYVCRSARNNHGRRVATCLLLKVDKDALAGAQRDIRRAGFHRIPHYASHAARRMGALPAAAQLLCIEIDENDGLSVNAEKLAETAKDYFDYVRLNTEDAAAEGEMFEPDRHVFEQCVEDLRGIHVVEEIGGWIGTVRFLYGPAAVLLAATVFAWSSLAYELHAEQWPVADAVVSRSQPGKGCVDSSKSWPDLAYRYRVGKKDYEGGKLDFSDLNLFIHTRIRGMRRTWEFSIPGNACRVTAETQAILKNFPVGTKVQVYVDPDHAGVAVLRRPVYGTGIYVVAAALVFAYSLLLVFAIANTNMLFDSES